MHSIRIARSELARIFGDSRFRLAAVVIMLVPLLYGALYLWAFWDPYGKLDQLPVALVNEDVPATVDGEQIAAGDDLVETLADKGTLEWHVVTEQAAEKGLHDGAYYMALRIPRDFSASLATANSEDPRPGKLVLTSHEASNMIASQIGDRVFSEVRTALAESVSRSYLDNIFVGFGDLRGSLGDAATGAKDLARGLDEARDGAASLADGATSAHAGAGALAAGSRKLATGAKDLHGGATKLADGTVSLATGLGAADAGSKRLAAGSRDAASGAESLAQGTAQIDAGAAKLAASATQLAGGAKQLDGGVQAAAPQLSSAASGSQQVAGGAAATYAALQRYAATHPDATGDPDFAQAYGAAEKTAAGSASLRDGLLGATGGFTALASGAHALATGADQLAAGAGSLADATARAASGANSLAQGVGTLAAGTGELAQGVDTAATGARKLAHGATALASGAGKLDGGMSSAAKGALKLSAGLALLDSGTHELASGLEPAVSGSAELASGLTAGVREVPAYSEATQSANARMMSAPVELEKRRLDPVPNYGTGFSPYFIPLSLWIGALMTFFVVQPVPPRAIEEGHPAPVAALAGLWPAALLAIAQSVILLVVLHTALGLHPRSMPALIAFAALASVVFVAILQWLSGTFGIAGKLFAIVLLMLQLTSSAGTYPLQTLPGFFRAISPFLPMTYVVAGLRQAISGGNWAALASDARHLAVFGLIAVALMTGTAYWARSWSHDKLHHELEL